MEEAKAADRFRLYFIPLREEEEEENEILEKGNLTQA